MKLGIVAQTTINDCECNYQDNYYGDQVCIRREAS